MHEGRCVKKQASTAETRRRGGSNAGKHQRPIQNPSAPSERRTPSEPGTGPDSESCGCDSLHRPLLIFDMDGVLVDVTESYRETIAATVREVESAAEAPRRG